ncbi:MAG: hypothetical protein P0S95_01255 [Rhabdochlamydiaceae bacterium]|nr:hypothetical protein [Candidatus Amphrikana amoebophyrae]
MRYLMTCRLKNNKSFWEHLNKATPRLPSGCSILYSWNSSDKKLVWIMWECDSIASLRQYIDRFLISFASFDYQQVIEESVDINEFKKAA